MNVYDFAMKMELDGKAYYEQLSAETPLTALQGVFRNMAADEQKHYEMVRNLKAGNVVEMADSTVLEEAKNLFEGAGVGEAVGGLKSALDGYTYARRIEADSIRFYEEMAAKESNPDTLRLIMKIIEEEKKHYNIMDNLYDYILAPQNYLAWAEFSNLKEY